MDSSSWQGLPEPVQRHILGLVGPHWFRFVGAVNRQWYRLYRDIHGIKLYKKTSLIYAVQSHGTRCIVLDEFHDWQTQGEVVKLVAKHYARAGNQSVLEHLKPYWSPILCEDICENAAFRGHLKLLKWARANGCPWNSKVCWLAAHSGHFEVLKWLIANGCPRQSNLDQPVLPSWIGKDCYLRDAVLCAVAALGGRLYILHWLREKNFPWDQSTCTSAAAWGQPV